MNWLLDNPLAQDIGMTLLHSLWQLAAVAVAFVIVDRLLQRGSATLRYFVAYSALLTMFALSCTTLCWLSSQPRIASAESTVALHSAPYPADVAKPTELRIEPVGAPDSKFHVAPEEMVFSQESAVDIAVRASDASKPNMATTHLERMRWSLPWISLAWALGVLAFSLRPVVALFRCRQLKVLAQPVEAPEFVVAFDALCERMGLHQQVELASSALVQVPTVIGFLRPIVLLPVIIANRANSARAIGHHCSRVGSCSAV